ncbi:MAG: DUF2288 domain-containing protein [Acidiferrobacterales bacterium]|nr:DUF2288 domain-containing protein [Acidiferrobacterales bacterium]
MVNEPSIIEKLHSETARIRWHDLQPYFAKGSLLLVDDSLDLVTVAADFAQDRAQKLSRCLESKLIAPPDNDQARYWYANNNELWAVVVAPFVLVQKV